LNSTGESLPPAIHTEHLLLRPWRINDADDVFAYAADPEWPRFLYLPQPYRRGHAEEFITRWREADPDTRVGWAVEFEGHAIGGINLRLEPAHRRAEVGYAVARSHWGKGLATESLSAVIETAFAGRPLNRLQATVDPENTASIRVLEKAGFAFERTLRRFEIYGGLPVDVTMYSVIREEWEANRG